MRGLFTLGIGKEIEAAIESWPGITTHEHRFGGVEFRLGRVELGHLHGDKTADLPFPKQIRDDIVAAGRAQPHHIQPESGWVTRRIRTDGDADKVIALFRLNYDRIVERRKSDQGGSETPN